MHLRLKVAEIGTQSQNLVLLAYVDSHRQQNIGTKFCQKVFKIPKQFIGTPMDVLQRAVVVKLILNITENGTESIFCFFSRSTKSLSQKRMLVVAQFNEM